MGEVSLPGEDTRLWFAFTLDMLFGEPPGNFHPVRWMGKAVEVAESVVPGREGGMYAQRAAGVLVAMVLPVGIYVATRAALRFTPAPLRGVAEIALLSTALAGRSLYDAAAEVERSLARDIDDGRAAVSRIVGRDTAALDEYAVVRATVESVAENANDGVVAPLFYAIAGGVPLALAYKMVNTLDSMVGYRNVRYRDFGWAAARLDDIAGYLPARLTLLAVAAASLVTGGDAVRVLKVSLGDGCGHESPNAGVCEGAFAGSLGVRLGGADRYGGTSVEKPVLGPGFRQPEREDIMRAARLMYLAAAMAMTAGTFVRRLIVWMGRR